MAQARYENLVGSLLADLATQTRVGDVYEDLYLGDHQSTTITEAFVEKFGEQTRELTSNWCGLIVDAAAGRLRVEGFQWPDLGSDVEGADPVANEIWEYNGLGSQQASAHTTMVYAGRSYLLAQPPLPGSKIAQLTVEHYSQAYTRMDPANPTRALAGILVYPEYGDDGTLAGERITVFLPDRTIRLQRKREMQRGVGWVLGRLIPRSGYPLIDEQTNPLGVVPLNPMNNKTLSLAAGPKLAGRRLMPGTLSDLHPVAPLQAFLKKGMAELAVLGDFASFPQRFATGIDIPTDPVTGDELDREEWAASIARLWAVPDKDAKFGEFPAQDGSGIIAKIAMLVQHMAAQSRTPPHYLLGQLVNISGDALTAAEAGLSERVGEKKEPAGGTWERSMRAACGFQGDMQRFGDRRCGTVWADHQVRSPAQTTDAVVKRVQAGILSRATAMQQLGMSPSQVTRELALLEAEAPEPAPVPSPSVLELPPGAPAPVVPASAA